MIRFSVFGIPVEVQPFFWVSMVILGGVNEADDASRIFQLCLFVFAGFLSILVHELGHALTARSFGAYSSITLQAFGGYAVYSGVRLSRWQSILVTAAGPTIQIVLGLVTLASLRVMPDLNEHSHYFLWQLMAISIVWAVLNLLPVVPLDGGQLLNSALGPRRIKVTLWVSIITATVVAVGVLMRDPRNFIFSIFMGMFAWQAFQGLKETNWR